MVSEEKRRGLQESKSMDYAKQHHTPPQVLQGDVSRELSQAFLLVDSINFNFVDEERSDLTTCIFFILALNHSLK